ncbi:MAG: hypothetical protein ACP5ER_00275, partial [Candidatus Bathyarchaeales archaeon]
MAFNFWKNATTKLKRVLTIAAVFILSILITIAGVLTPLSAEEAAQEKQHLDEIQTTIDSLPNVQKVSFIFGNNFMICLSMFVP